VGLPFVVRPADGEEEAAGDPEAVAAENARRKATGPAPPGRLVLGADTVVAIDGDVLGKPADDLDAVRMLARLAGRSHVVVTAVAVSWRGETRSAVEEVGVTFHPMSRTEIDAYIATREPMDKAGAYGIQGYGATIVSRVDGDYFAVMGLPLQRLTRVLASLGIRYGFGPLEVADA
jgi:septum formation protein